MAKYFNTDKTWLTENSHLLTLIILLMLLETSIYFRPRVISTTFVVLGQIELESWTLVITAVIRTTYLVLMNQFS